eukprot:gene30472-35485_t
MNEIEVENQISQMCKFIKQEADEKSTELRVQAEEEFNLEKLSLLEQEKAKIRKEYERREAQVDVKKKIEYSKQLNEMRLKVLAAREQAIQEIVEDSKLKLREAMRKLAEKSAIVRARQVDLTMVKDVLEPARKAYFALFNEEAPSLTMDQDHFLPPPPTGDSELESCNGGVLVASMDGRIMCSNTLDERIKIAYHANLPDIRARLFGVLAKGEYIVLGQGVTGPLSTYPSA